MKVRPLVYAVWLVVMLCTIPMYMFSPQELAPRFELDNFEASMKIVPVNGPPRSGGTNDLGALATSFRLFLKLMSRLTTT